VNSTYGSNAANNNSPARFATLCLAAVLAVLSCRSGESTSPASSSPETPVEPIDFQSSVALVFAAGPTMTVGVTVPITLAAVNVLPQSCVVSGPWWLMLSATPDANSAWNAAPSQTGIAPLVTKCKDSNHRFVTAFDTVRVFAMPSVTPDMAGSVPVGLGDSVDVTYDSTDTHTIDVACVNCTGVGALTRVGPNTLRFYAQHVATDALHRSICFTVHGLDGHYTQQRCVGVVVRGGQVALFSIPEAVRQAEVVALHTVPVATYDNTGQSTHPDFMRVGASWSDGACWLVYTPYAGSNGNVENPSLARSPDCEHWSPAPGVRAPLFDRPSDGYNSDPELIYDSLDGCLGIVFRQVTSSNQIVMSHSCDGTTWPTPRLLFAAPNHRAISPTIAAGPDGRNRVWYVDAGSLGCSSLLNVVRMRMATPTASSSLDSVQFGSEVATDLVQRGYVIWHIKIRYVPEKNLYLAMYAAFPLPATGPGNCATSDLFVATSTDGLHWTSFPVPIINKLDRRFNFTTLYRASFAYNPKTDNLRTITSALEDTWGQYGVVYNFTALMTALNTSTTVAASRLVPSFKLVRKADPHRKVVKIEDQP
jgi:hypothetical protein